MTINNSMLITCRRNINEFIPLSTVGETGAHSGGDIFQ